MASGHIVSMCISFCNVMCCGKIEDFIHFPTWSWNEVQKLTSHARAILFEQFVALAFCDEICGGICLELLESFE